MILCGYVYSRIFKKIVQSNIYAMTRSFQFSDLLHICHGSFAAAADIAHTTPCIMQIVVHVHVCIAYQLEIPGNCKNVLNCKTESSLRVTISFFPPAARKIEFGSLLQWLLSFPRSSTVSLIPFTEKNIKTGIFQNKKASGSLNQRSFSLPLCSRQYIKIY